MGSQSYRDLTVWRKGIALCIQVYEVCGGFPRSELYNLSDQMKRAAVSVPSNIAEGQGRQHVKEFLHFLSVAKGSLAELDTQRIIAESLSLVSPESSSKLERSIIEVQKMLHALMNRLRAQG